MRKILTIGLITIIGIVCFSCEKAEMVKYESGDRLNFIGYDDWGLLKDDKNLLVWSGNFGINPQGDSLKLDTLKVGVRVSGEAAGIARKLFLKVKNISEEKAEILLRDDYVMPADTGLTEIEVYVKRPARRNTDYEAGLEFDYEKSGFERGTLERQTYVLKFKDVVSKELWEVNETYFNFYFGDWSETKARFMITVTGAVSFSKWVASARFEQDYFHLLDEFERYKADPSNPPLLDDNGQWIAFPELF